MLFIHGLSTSPPVSPSPSKERGRICERGFASLKLSLSYCLYLSLKGKREEILERGETPSLLCSPFP
jgi:hypothetical protein